MTAVRRNPWWRSSVRRELSVVLCNGHGRVPTGRTADSGGTLPGRSTRRTYDDSCWRYDLFLTSPDSVCERCTSTESAVVVRVTNIGPFFVDVSSSSVLRQLARVVSIIGARRQVYSGQSNRTFWRLLPWRWTIPSSPPSSNELGCWAASARDAARSSQHAQSPRGRRQRWEGEPSVTNSGHPVTFEDNADRRAGRTRTSACRWRSTRGTCTTTNAGHGPLATPVDGSGGLVRYQISTRGQRHRRHRRYMDTELARPGSPHLVPTTQRTSKFTSSQTVDRTFDCKIEVEEQKWRRGPRRYTFGPNTSRQSVADGGLPNAQ